MGLSAYPVGSVYMNMLAPSPRDVVYGVGEWMQLDGVFIRASKTGVSGGSDADGGSDSMALAITNLPIHCHTVGAHAHGVGTISATGGGHAHTVQLKYQAGKSANVSSGGGAKFSSDGPSWSGAVGLAGANVGGLNSAHTHTMSGATANSAAFNSGNAGGGQPFDNRPAYKNVYAWVRIA